MKVIKYVLPILLWSITACQNTPDWQTKPVAEWPPNEGQYALLVAQNGKTVFEKYYHEADKNKLCNVQSLTKSMMSLLVGIAIEQGKISNENEPIHPYFPTIFANLKDKRKEQISIKDLLNQTAGLEWKGYKEHGAWLESPTPNQLVLSKQLLTRPGKAYFYNSGATHLLSTILVKATGQSVLAFAQENLFTPLGIKTVKWEVRNDGHHDGSGLGLWMQASDLLKIGQLMLNKGKWHGQQLIAEAWIDKSFNSDLKSKAAFGLPRSKHGYCWYSTERNGLQMHYGMGYGGQFIFLLPSEDLVIVTTHNHDTADGIPQQVQFVTQYLSGLIANYGKA